MISFMDTLFFVVVFHLFGLYLGKLWSDFYYRQREDVERSESFSLTGHKPRDSKWRSVRNKIIDDQGSCAICGKTKNLRVHHKIPFHIDPSLELVEENLIVLCENENLNCHFVFGHLMNWNDFNPNIDEDIKFLRKRFGS